MLRIARLGFLRRRGVVAATAGVALVGLAIAGVAYAQTPTPGGDGTPRTFIQRFAQRLGLSEAQVTQAATDVRNEMLDEAVAAGRLTPEQADRVRNRPIDQGFGPKLGGPHGRGLGGHLPGAKGFLKAEFDAIAQFLGMSSADLQAELRAGRSLAEVAQAKGKTREDLLNKIIQDAQAHAAMAVQDGKLTQAQADQLIQRAPETINRLVDAKPGSGQGSGWPGRPGREQPSPVPGA